MDSSGSLFSQTLHNITTAKLEELARKRNHFENQQQAVVTDAQSKQDPVETRRTLSDGIKTCFGVAVDNGRVIRGSTDKPRLEIDLKNLDRFVAQARYDPSVSTKLLASWRETMLRHLETQSLKFSYASLYGQLTTEWLQSKQAQAKPLEGSDMEMKDFEVLSGAEKMESRMRWERLAFEEAQIDDEAINKMLRELFEPQGEDRDELIKALKTLRKRVEEFARTLTTSGGFNHTTLGWTIDGLLRGDLLTEEKREVLRSFQNNKIILTEIADMLNMRMASLETWTWGDKVQLEERRQLNGNFNIYMHEDLLHAVFLQYIGVKWSVFWKRTFADFRKSRGVWKTLQQAIPLLDRKRRDYYLGDVSRRSVESEKRKIYRRSYYLSQLLESESQVIFGEEGDEEADFEHANATQRRKAQNRMAQQSYKRSKQTARVAQTSGRGIGLGQGGALRHRKIISQDERDTASDFEDDEDDVTRSSKTPMETKQRLLHLLSADVLIKTRTHGEITCFRSQFESLYPSLPHSTINAVLAFFGVPKKWLDFFRRFLQAPLCFMDEKPAAPRLRKRGTPGAHVLSEVFGEVVLFCLDFQVNQETHGETLWRLHDDFWFWSSKQSTCTVAWRAIDRFTKSVGLSLNPARTGSTCMQRTHEKGNPDVLVEAAVEKPLPDGQIRWGMLALNPNSGRFEIDQTLVDQHISELRRQLADQTHSVFAWIQAWNSYASTFFTSNFGKPAICFGRSHVDNMLATVLRAQPDHQRLVRQPTTLEASPST